MIEYHEEVKRIEEEQTMNYITTAERIGIERGMEIGHQKGEVALLTRQLIRRFHHIPDLTTCLPFKKRITTPSLWGERVLDAATLEEVFE